MNKQNYYLKKLEVKARKQQIKKARKNKQIRRNVER